MEKEHILKSLNKGLRYDGRKLLDYREVFVEQNISHSAEGSARVKIGGTEVLVGVKMSIEKPYPDTPNKGNLMVNAELRPMSSPKFESGPPGIQAIELSRVIDRGLRESKTIDQEKLCIEPGEKVWGVIIDIVPINDEGNLLDAAALGAIVALKNARYPAVREDGSVNYAEKTDEKLPLSCEPIEVTVIKIGDNFIVDPLSVEEEAVDARLTIAIAEDDTIYAMQKGGEEPLNTDDINKMVDIALDKTKELRKHLK